VYVLLLVLMGCVGSPTSSGPVVSETAAVAATEAIEKPKARKESQVIAAVTPPSSGEASEVVLVWQGISPLHKTFFLDERAIDQLGRDLSAHVVQPANVYISFDSKLHIGRILLRLLPGTGVGLVPGDAGDLNLAVISPILQGLARYRSRVAGRYDTRVEAFYVGIDSYRGPNHCRFGAVGPQPPDGTMVNGCVQLNGVEQCGVPTGGGIRYEREVADAIRACLR
jgi:hypothetical protein